MSDAPDSIDSSSKSGRRRSFIIGFIFVAVVVAAFFFAKPVYHHFKGWRSRQLAAKAEVLMAEAKWPQAVEKAQAAVVLSQSEPTALRAMARVLTHLTNVNALKYWQQLIVTGNATDADQRSFVELAIQSGEVNAAVAQLQKLLASGPEEPRNLWLASQLFVTLRDYSQTVDYASRASVKDPGNRQYRLFVSSLQFDAPQAEKRAEARTNLWIIAKGEDELGIEALRFLAKRQDLTAEQGRQLVSQLTRHALGVTSDELLVLSLQTRLEPERRSEILGLAAERYKTATPEARNQFAVWLNQNGELEKTLVALPLEDAIKRRDLFLPYADALAGLGRWEELQTILSTKQVPLEEVYAEAFRARCAIQLTNEPLATLHWRSSMRSAERNPDQLVWLAAYAQKCGDYDIAKATVRLLISCLKDTRPGYRLLAQLTEQSGTTQELRDILGEMMRFWPADHAVRNDYAYLSLLLSEKIADSRQTAEELVKQFPDSLTYRTTLALALYRLNDLSGALQVYDGKQYTWSQADGHARAVYAGVLAANGKTVEAGELARSIRRTQLRGEELEIIRPLLHSRE